MPLALNQRDRDSRSCVHAASFRQCKDPPRGALRRDIASGGYGNHIRGSGRDTGDFTIDAWLNESNGAISDRAFADRARTTAAALEAIARLPGRENLI